jgi:hypothetical protein
VVELGAPDDGRRNRLKHVERLAEINELCNVAPCWLYLKIHLRCTDPWTSMLRWFVWKFNEPLLPSLHLSVGGFQKIHMFFNNLGNIVVVVGLKVIGPSHTTCLIWHHPQKPKLRSSTYVIMHFVFLKMLQSCIPPWRHLSICSSLCSVCQVSKMCRSLKTKDRHGQSTFSKSCLWYTCLYQ